MKSISLLLLCCSIFFGACAQKSQPASTTSLTNLPETITNPEEYNELTDNEKYVILQKGTEYAFSGKYHKHKETGTYICAQCNLPLFTSESKFNSGTGWPSFDDMIANNVKELPDADGRRTEIVCNNCGGHLGHVFKGEGFTNKQTRHCVNSASLDFVAASATKSVAPAVQEKNGISRLDHYVKDKNYANLETAYFAGGCFWCTEASFERINGVVDVISGYSGGEKEFPTYKEVGYGKTNHAEAIAIFYDPAVITYETLLDVFFVAHDPTTLNRQGPDVGKQYRSEIFYADEEQKALAEKTIEKLNKSGKFKDKIVTTLSAYDEFWVAEAYHQNFYEINPRQSYVYNVSRPKVEKVMKTFKDILKEEYK